MKDQASQHLRTNALRLLTLSVLLILCAPLAAAEKAAGLAVYDEAAYTTYVEDAMAQLDQLYIDYTAARGHDAVAAEKAEKAFLSKVHELLQHMNAKFDSLDPKKGAALSMTEMFVSIHAQTMLIDILTTNQIEHISKHPYIE
jgi:hypothetical protein